MINNQNMIEKNDIAVLDEILGLIQVNNHQIAMMENFAKKYIDKNMTICRHCSAQVRHAHQRIINWAGINQAMIEYVRNFEEPKKCECGNDLPDKRYKRCLACIVNGKN